MRSSLVLLRRHRSPAARRSSRPSRGRRATSPSPTCSSTTTASTSRRSSTSTRARKRRPAATASAEAAVAATERRAARRSVAGCSPLLAAALALPGVVPRGARAVGARQGHLRAAVLELSRLAARARTGWTCGRPAFYALLPIGDTWVVEGGMVYDAMSGASPLLLQRAVGRVDLRLPDRRRRQGHQVLRRLAVSVGGASCRRSRTSCRAAARSTCRSSARTATARGLRRRPAPTTASTRPTASRPTRRATRSSSWSA